MRDVAREGTRPAEPVAEGEAEAAGSGPRTSYAGPIPPVAEETGAGDHRTASELAYGDEQDKNVQELKSKVGSLVDKRFGGDYLKAFEHYDSDRDGAVSRAEIVALLEDAGVGNGFTRGMWANGIIDKLDATKDAKIQWPEFEAVFKAVA